MTTQPQIINQHLSNVASDSHRESQSSSSSSEEEAPIMRRQTSSTGSPYPFLAAEKADDYFAIPTPSTRVVDDVEENDPNYKLLHVASPTAVNPSGLSLQRRLSAKEARQVWKTRCCAPQDSANQEKSHQQQAPRERSPRQPSLQQLFDPRPSLPSKVSFVCHGQKA